MKEIQYIKYEANDGRTFDKKEECLRWEKCLATDKEQIKKEVNDFLAEIANYDAWAQTYLVNSKDFTMCYELHLGSRDGGVYDLTLGNMYESGFQELDEDFAIDMDKWNFFKKEIKKKYDVYLDEDLYYWSK